MLKECQGFPIASCRKSKLLRMMAKFAVKIVPSIEDNKRHKIKQEIIKI